MDDTVSTAHAANPAADPGVSQPRLAALLAASAALCLVAAGAILWARGGEAVFTTLVTSALAWCF